MISYAKGACWIKVMDNFLGRQTLKRGIQLYFDRFSHSNTVLNDLVGCLNEAMCEVRAAENSTAPEIDLFQWTDSWLKKQGPNTLLVERDPATQTWNIRQDFANEYASSEYREQRVDVLMLSAEDPSKKLLLENILVTN